MSVHGRILVNVLALLVLAGGAQAAGVREEPALTSGIGYFTGTDGAEHAYWLELPQMEPGRKYPLILHFHGHGGGTPPNIANIQTEPFARFRELALEHGYILAAPAYGRSSWMNASGRRIARDFLRFLVKHLPVDTTRVYSTGVSMGGGGALTFAMFYPRRVAAVVDFMGVSDFARFYNAGFYHDSLQRAFGGTPEEVPDVYREQSAALNAEKLADVPVLIIHGDADRTVPVWNSRILHSVLKAAGGTVKYIEVPGGTHRNEIVQGLEEEILGFLGRYAKQNAQ